MFAVHFSVHEHGFRFNMSNFGEIQNSLQVCVHLYCEIRCVLLIFSSWSNDCLQIDEGDYVDMVMERFTEDAELMVKRVKVIRVSSERTSSDKREVTVKVWKKAFPVEDKTKPQY